MLESLMNHTNFVDECTDISSYFSSKSCNWNTGSRCSNNYNGEEGALRCLLEGNGDVAFLSYETFKKFKGKCIKKTLLQPSNKSVSVGPIYSPRNVFSLWYIE